MRKEKLPEMSEPIEPEIFKDEEAEGVEREAILVKLDSFGNTLAKTRKEAIQGRAASGIETEWAEDEGSYQGIDSANRDADSNKPISSDGGSANRAVSNTRSRVFLNITRAYVDAASAKVADMLLPTDEDNFSIIRTPSPELEAKKDDAITPVLDDQLNPMMQQILGPDGQPIQKQATVKDAVQELLAKADDAAEKAKTRISDWFVECDYHNEFRKVIEDAAKLGTGVLKGPFPVVSKSKKVSIKDGERVVEAISKISPASKRVDVFNLFPDPSCGDNIHKGSYIWERDEISGRSLRELGNDDSYIIENIHRALEEGPTGKQANENRGNNPQNFDNEQFEIWYYYGFVEKEDLENAGCDCEELEDYVPAIVVMVNDHVIKAALNPLSTGAFPFDVFVWQSRTDSWAGVGVSRQIRTPQRMLNAATRNMMDNAGLSSGPQLILRRGVVTPADGQWTITPRKIWYADEEADLRSVSDAIVAINIPTMQAELLSIIQFASKMAEDVTGLPMILQGQQGQAPETVGGMQMLSNNASTVLRRLARNADGMLIKPHVRRYYDWLLEDPDVPEDEKGDFKIDARGSSALVERDLHNQLLGQALQLSLNPAFGLSPARTLKEFLASKRIDVRKLGLTEEEKAQIAEAQKNQPQDPRLLSAQASIEATKIRTQAEVQKAQAQSQADQVEIQTRMEDARQDRIYRMQELEIQREIEMLKLANAKQISLETIKAQLTQTAMTEKNKRDLFAAEAALKKQEGSGI